VPRPMLHDFSDTTWSTITRMSRQNPPDSLRVLVRMRLTNTHQLEPPSQPGHPYPLSHCSFSLTCYAPKNDLVTPRRDIRDEPSCFPLTFRTSRYIVSWLTFRTLRRLSLIGPAPGAPCHPRHSAQPLPRQARLPGLHVHEGWPVILASTCTNGLGRYPNS